MIPAKFDYVRPGLLGEAVRALADGGDDAKVIAGGQSLLPLLRLRLANPVLLVDVGGLGELRGVTDTGDALLIGARTTHYQLIHDPLIRGALRAACTSRQRGRRSRHPAPGTLGPSLAHADPAGDLPAVALALDATLIARGPGGEREISAADFFVDYLTSSPGTRRDPDGDPGTQAGRRVGFRYEKFHRTAQSWATVGVAALVRRSTARSPRPGSGSPTWARHRCEPRRRRPPRGGQASRDVLRVASVRADEGTNPPATWTERLITGDILPGS